MQNFRTICLPNFDTLSMPKCSSDDSASFYSASALLAMQTAVIATGCLSVRLSVRPSVTFRCFVQKNEDTIMQFSPSGRTIILVLGKVKIVRIFAGDHPSEGIKVRHYPVASENLTNNRNDARQEVS